ncbi:hypothetical protein RHSIM_Rhsim10G0110600 [Rhododendron simsii]|uniref:Uncharacterized protein n=1 Tax=Rhododendron simsii TaxID=118357 RepID=A0A834LCM6_RHOSS|nr:hypothetical protein RHSIM_Rhsim10G0110600 [Rhododendron simsii]
MEVVCPVTLGINLVWGDPDLNEIGNIYPEADDLEGIVKAIKKKSTGYSELGHQTIGTGKPSTPKLKIDKNVLTQAIQVGAFVVENGLDHTDGLATVVATEVPFGSISKTLSHVLSPPPPVGHTDLVKMEGTKAKSPAETTSGQEVGDVRKKRKVGFQSLGQPSSSETDPMKWSQQDGVDMSRLIYPRGSEFP